jgi:zinc transport system permease protein
MVLPVATAMQLAKSYKQTVVYSILFALFFTITGLFISYYANFKPGGTIVLVGVLTLVSVLVGKNISHKGLIKRTN